MRLSRSPGAIAGVALGMLLVTVAFRPAELSAQTSQDFNAVGTPYNSSQSGTSIAPTVMAGGPTGANFLRLLGAASTAGTNSIAFDRSNPGAFTQIVADFDFRMTPGTALRFAPHPTA